MMTSPFTRVILPLDAQSNQHQAVLPATVLASWFGVPVQIVCNDPDAVEGYQSLAVSLGTAVEPVLYIEGDGIEGLVAHANSHAPALIVTDPSPAGLERAAASTQPVFIAAPRQQNRLTMGPLAVEVTGSSSDLDALALAGVIAPTLDESIRLVAGTDGTSGDGDPGKESILAEGEHRLAQMGCEVGIDSLRAHGLYPLVLVGRTRSVTAMVIPQERLAERGLVEKAMDEGVNVLVAPARPTGTGRPAPFDRDLSIPKDLPPPGAAVGTLDRSQCIARLEGHRVARLGYIESGWPTIVPINYRVWGGDIIIRTLAGGKLRAAERRDTVCLELDAYDETLRSGWSVVAHGVLEVIRDSAILAEAWANDPEPWIASEQWQWLRMVPFSVSGREVLPGLSG